jgi:DNA-binding NtrC family response regulator
MLMRELQSPSVANLESHYHAVLADSSFQADASAPCASLTTSEGRDNASLEPATDSHCLSIRVGTALADVERQMIMATLGFCGGNKTRAAAVLGVSLKTLYNRLNEYRSSSSNEGGISSFPMSCAR